MSAAKPQVLIVDDREENLLALRGLLKEQDAEVLVARSGTDALELLLVHDVALALIDVQMPSMDGFELAELMRGAERTREIPIILVTAGLHDPMRIFKGYESGAVDFLFKPLDRRILSSKVAVFLGLYRQKQQLLETKHRLMEALANAEEAVRLRDQVVSLVSHDLRNPLSAITTQTALLRRQLEERCLDEDRLAAGLIRIERNSSRIEGLIGELLDVAQLRAGRDLTLDRSRFDLVALSRQVADEHQRAAPRHRVEVRAAPPSVVGEWDRSRIERVLDNLISNAIKYSPAGGAVIVEIRGAREGGAGWAVVRVQDQGIGIPARSVPHIFQWFTRAANTEGTIRGTGLGLAGARHIVEQHGGSISVDSEEGKGSTFTIRLPL